MLNPRYTNDGKNIVKFNNVQQQAKEDILRKIKEGIYTYENVYCPICDVEKQSFQILAQKDRYGLDCTTVICDKCGLLITNPRLSQFSYNQFYEKEYRQLYVGNEKASYDFFNDQYKHGLSIIKYICKNSSLNLKDKYVLEVGCGAGGILAAFKDHGANVLGLDLGEEYLKYGIENYGLTLEKGSIHDYQFTKVPDIIIYSHVLEHVLDLSRELERIKQISHASTLVYIEVPGIKNIHNAYFGNFLLYLQNAHTYHFSLNTLSVLFSKNGFTKITGNENIQSLFCFQSQSENHNEKFINEYKSIIKYLKFYELLYKCGYTYFYKCLKKIMRLIRN